MTDLIVLAAGLGRRLASRSARPKWLTPVGDATPVARQLTGAVAAGVTTVRVVVSDVSGPVAAAVEPWRDRLEIRLVGNDRAHDRNNWFSLLLGLEDWLPSDAVGVAVANSDLFATSSWFTAALAAMPQPTGAAVAVDTVRPLTDEAMKVAADEHGCLRAIGKVGVAEPQGEYVGLSWWSRATALGLRDVLAGFVPDLDRADCWYEHGIQEHVGAGANYHVVPVPSTAWVEIDDAADLDAARALPTDPAR